MLRFLNNLMGTSSVSVGRGFDSTEDKLRMIAQQIAQGGKAIPLSDQDDRRAWVRKVLSEELSVYPSVPDPLLHAYMALFDQLLAPSPLFKLPNPRSLTGLNLNDQRRKLDALVKQRELCADTQGGLAQLHLLLSPFIHGVLQHLPSSVFHEKRGGEHALSLSLTDLIAHPDSLFDELLHDCQLKDQLKSSMLLDPVLWQIDDNLLHVSGIDPQNPKPSDKALLPSQMKGTATDKIRAYFGHTPFPDFFATPLPFQIPEKKWHEHCHLMAGTGHGKTQTLFSLVLDNLHRLANGDPDAPGMIIIDSQEDLLPPLMKLDLFNPDRPGSLADRFVYIDVTDVENAPALNLFDPGITPEETENVRAHEQAYNGLLQSMNYIMSNLMGNELTPKMTVVFGYLSKLLLSIPGANIMDLLAILDGSRDYDHHIAKLTGVARQFFEREYRGKTHAGTLTAIKTRLYQVLQNTTLERLFTARRNAVPMREIFDQRKVLFINTSKKHLQSDNSALVGKFFLSQIMQAVYLRLDQDKYDKPSVRVFIDEAHEYLNDNIIEEMIAQARKASCGIVFAHQYWKQFASPTVRAAIQTCAIKMVGKLNDEDRVLFAKEMGTTPDFISSMTSDPAAKQTQFALSVKDILPRAATMTVPMFVLDDEPVMPDDSFARLLKANAARLADVKRDPVTSVEPDGQTRLHVQVQNDLAQHARALGFQALLEHPVSGGFIDLALHGFDRKLAVEVSDTNRKAYELSNITKCLSAGYQVFMVSADAGHLSDIQDLARAQLDHDVFAAVQFMRPDSFLEYLSACNFPTPSPSKHGLLSVCDHVVEISDEEKALKRFQLTKLLESVS